MKIGVLLSGSGFMDGAEIQESVSVLIALDQLGHEVICMAPNIQQHHVVNHITGEEESDSRNVLIESARISRGNIKDLSEVSSGDFDALVLPGGFGAAKNLSKWAFSGPDGDILPDVQRIISETHQTKKPIVALCVSPVVIAKALSQSGVQSILTVGTTAGESPYDISGFNQGLSSVGVQPQECALGEVVVDEENKIVTSPCYMMEASPAKIFEGVVKACKEIAKLSSISA